MGSHTVPLWPGSLTAYSTRLLLPGTVATFSAYWPGAKISFRIAPSCTSPRIPRVFTPESTCFRLPTSAARFCISPRPLYTCSSWVLTARNDSLTRRCSVASSFSSTVPRISSSFLLLSARMFAMPCSRVARTPSSRLALVSSRFFRRVSSTCS